MTTALTGYTVSSLTALLSPRAAIATVVSSFTTLPVINPLARITSPEEEDVRFPGRRTQAGFPISLEESGVGHIIGAFSEATAGLTLQCSREELLRTMANASTTAEIAQCFEPDIVDANEIAEETANINCNSLKPLARFPVSEPAELGGGHVLNCFSHLLTDQQRPL